MDSLRIETYLQKQKIKVVKEFNFENKTVKYSDKIKGWKIEKFKGEEEIVRAYLLAKLVNDLGYKEEQIELEKEYDIGRPKVNKPRIDIIVYEDDNPFLYIELKSPQEYERDKDEVIEKQLFNLASQEVGQAKTVTYLVLFTVDVIEDVIQDKALLIDYKKFNSFEKWKEIRDFSDQIPARYGKAQKEPYVKGSKTKDLLKNFSYEQLMTKRTSLHNVLWGGGGTDDNDVFSSLVNIILAKIQDESEKNIGEEYDFQILSFKNEDGFETNDELFERINELYRRALKHRLNIVDEKKLKKSFVVDENKFLLTKLKFAVQELEQFSFVDSKNSLTGKDILGDFFEGIIRKGFKQNKGQFFTHVNIVRFMLWGIQLDKLAIDRVNNDSVIPYFIDPSAGSGTFLIEYMKFITENLKRRFRNKVNQNRDIEDKFQEWFFPDDRENKWASKYIYGCEHNFNLGTATKVNMILHGDGSSNIFVKDGLARFTDYQKKSEPNVLKQFDEDLSYQNKHVNSQFDCILTNPPFSVDLDDDLKKNVKEIFVFKSYKKAIENLFIERYYQLLRENGRLGVILPESVFDTTENKYIRLFIYRYFKIKAVVSLPQLTFAPYTGTKTSILFAQKKTKSELQKWDDEWKKSSESWGYLSTRAKNLIDVYLKDKDRKKLKSIKDLSKDQERDLVTKFLKNQIQPGDESLDIPELISTYSEELKGFIKYDKETKDLFGFVNTSWVFNDMAASQNYDVLMCGADNVGYKRTKIKEKPMENDLFREKLGEILIDDGEQKVALDYLRTISWE